MKVSKRGRTVSVRFSKSKEDQTFGDAIIGALRANYLADAGAKPAAKSAPRKVKKVPA
jgi:hypothetical protein